MTLRFSYLWTGPEAKALERLIAKFNESQDRILVQGVSNPDTQKQLAQMSSSSGFDISDNFGSVVGSWASKGIIRPLDEYIQGDKYDLSDFVPAALDNMKYEGRIYALPITVHTLLLLYNKQLLQAAGLQDPPSTVSELATAIERLTKLDPKGNIQQLGLGLPSYLAFVYPFGGSWVNAQGEPWPDNPANVRAISFVVDHIIKKYGVEAIKRFQSGFGEYASPQNPFYVGKLAMTIDGEWQAQFIREYAPDLEWAAVPLPYLDGKPELKGSTEISTSMFFIPSNSRHPEEAWEFLKYLVSREAMLEFAYALANLPARRSLLDNSKFGQIPGFKPWLESLRSPNLHFFPNAAWAAEYQTELTSAFDKINNLKASPAEAMAEVARKMRQRVRE